MDHRPLRRVDDAGRVPGGVGDLRSDRSMNEIRPLGSRMASLTLARSSMPCWRAASSTSSIGSRSTSRVRSIGRPSWTMTIGTPSDDGRHAARAPRDVRQHRDPERERRPGQHGAGQRVVLLGDALLDDVAERDQQQQLERRQVGQRPPLQPAREHEQEDEDDVARRMISTTAAPSCRTRRRPRLLVTVEHGDGAAAALTARPARSGRRSRSSAWSRRVARTPRSPTAPSSVSVEGAGTRPFSSHISR